jgi:hypothetical protein
MHKDRQSALLATTPTPDDHHHHRHHHDRFKLAFLSNYATKQRSFLHCRPMCLAQSTINWVMHHGTDEVPKLVPKIEAGCMPEMVQPWLGNETRT